MDQKDKLTAARSLHLPTSSPKQTESLIWSRLLASRSHNLELTLYVTQYFPDCLIMTQMFSFLLKWNLGVEVLDHKVTMCLTFWRTARQFSKWLHHLHSCQKCMRFLVSLHPNQYMLLSVFMNLALLARTTLSWLPLFCRKFCNWGVQILLYSFSRLFFAILGPLNSIWILGSACQFLQRSYWDSGKDFVESID